MKITNTHTVESIAQELGSRLRQERLNRNITQAAIAKLAGITRKKVSNAEAGNADLATVVALMQSMKIADQLNNFLPPVAISPMQLMKLAGKKRQRASGDSELSEGENEQESSTW